MIRCTFPDILGQKQLKITKVSDDTKISRPTLTALYYNTSKGIQFETLDKLCKYLKITHKEFFEFIPVDISLDIKSAEINEEQNRPEEDSMYIDIEASLIHFDQNNYKTVIDLTGLCWARESIVSPEDASETAIKYDYGVCTIGVKETKDVEKLCNIISSLSLGFKNYVENLVQEAITLKVQEKGITKLASLKFAYDMTYEEYNMKFPKE